MHKIIREDIDFIIKHDLSWKLFSGKNILITGANGFLPAYMLEVLLFLYNVKIIDKPCKVFAMVKNTEHAKERFIDYIDNPFFSLIPHDVSKQFHINEKIDFIIHAASPASPKYFGRDPVGVILPNVVGTINILDLAREHGSSVLYFSSGEVYGNNPEDIIVKENSYGFMDPLDIRSCYGESKRMGENLCACYGYQYDIPVKIIRISHTYGPGMKLDDGRAFVDFVRDIIANKNIELKSDGSVKRPFCYISDAVAGFFTVLLKGANNEAYNIANPYQTISIKDLANMIVDMFPEKGLKVLFAKRNDDKYLETKVKGNIPSIGKAKDLGWTPSVSVKEGFRRTIESYLPANY